MNTTPPPLKNDEKANTLCILSIVLFFINPVILSISHLLLTHYGTLNSIILIVSKILSSGCGIGSLVLLIYVRVTYPNNKFGNILMWVYIILFIASMILIFVSIVACGFAIGSCLQGCGEIG